MKPKFGPGNNVINDNNVRHIKETDSKFIISYLLNLYKYLLFY